MVLRWVVGNWLRSEATRRAEEALGEAMRSRADRQSGESGEASQSDEATSDRQEESLVCDVGLVFALSIEAGGLVDLLEGAVKIHGAGFVARTGALAGRRVVLVESGPSDAEAAGATARLIAGHRPRWIISAGFAGALDERLHRGDILVADSIVSPAGEPMAIDMKLQPTSHVHVGRLVTVDHIVRTPQERRALAEQHGAVAVDMESYAVAAVCRQEKVCCLSVRVISDQLDDRLPPDVQHLMRQTSLSGKLGAATGSLFRRPGSVKDLWRLRENALVASDRLAQFLKGMLPQLAPRAEDGD